MQSNRLCQDGARQEEFQLHAGDDHDELRQEEGARQEELYILPFS